MTDKQKLEKIKSLADKMYTAMQYLTTDTTSIKKAMNEYHQFIIQHWDEEEPVSEGLKEEIKNYFIPNDKSTPQLLRIIANHFANWQKEQMIKNAVERTVHVDEDLCPFIRKYEMAYDIKKQIPDIKEGDKVKVVIIKEN